MDHVSLATDKLASSLLTLEDAKALGIDILSPPQASKLIDYVKQPALKLNYYSADKRKLPVYRLRLLGAPPKGAFGEVVTPSKYVQPKNTQPAAYLPRSLEWQLIAKDKGRSIIFTEGELKAACAVKHGFACIGLGGVWSFRSTKHSFPLLPELEAIEWSSRDVVICFDSDANDNPQILAAQVSFANVLRAHGALVRVCTVPSLPHLQKTGLDDYAAVGNSLTTLFDSAKPLDDLTAHLYGFNSRFAVILDGNGSVFIDQTQAQTGYNAFLTSYGNVHASKTVASATGTRLKDVKVAQEWLEWPQRRTYEALTYEPGKGRIVGNRLNAWQGFATEPKRGDIGPWKALLARLFPSDNTLAMKWFERWLAYPIANPGVKQMTCACLWSYEQGIGKSTIGSTMRAIYGAANFATISQNDLESDFNAMIVNRQFVLVDDMSAHDSRAKADLLKKMITEETTVVKRKYVSEYEVPACANYFITTNRPNALYLEGTSERRYFIHQAHGKPDKAFFDTYRAWLCNGGASHLHAHFLSLPFGDYSPYDAALVTADMAEMAENSRQEVDAWVADLRDTAPRDIYNATELTVKFNSNAVRKVTAVQMGISLSSAKVHRTEPMWTGAKTERVYFIRNHDKWIKASNKEIVSYLEAERRKGL